jgi:molybdopterin synthase catalytic subunit
VRKTRIQPEDFDLSVEMAAMRAGGADIGALASFVGLCRSEQGQLQALELEHYPPMAEAEIAGIAAQAEQRWPLLGLTIIHRYGRIEAGEQIVLVMAAAHHRAEAFAAAEFVMDYLKTRAPFWKRLHRRDGSAGEWVSATERDEARQRRWAES